MKNYLMDIIRFDTPKVSSFIVPAKDKEEAERKARAKHKDLKNKIKSVVCVRWF